MWRKQAFNTLVDAREYIGANTGAEGGALTTTQREAAAQEEHLAVCMDTFRERIDFEVENTVRGGREDGARPKNER